MCIAIYKPANKIINKENLAQCFKANSDGAGFLVAKNKQLIMKKGFFTFDEFYEAYLPYAEEQCLIHFRIKTHGDINQDNCHPFMINKGLGFIHNGIISGFGLGTISDTSHFNNSIFKPLVAKYGNQVIFEPAIQELVEARIGYSKLAFLDRHGNYQLFNEDKGVWDNEVWYSNTSYKIPMVFKGTAPVAYLPKTTVKPKHRTVEVNDIVVLIAGIYDHPSKVYHKSGGIYEVVAVNKDYTVDLMADEPDDKGQYGFLYNVSYTKFDFVEIDPTNPYDNDWNTHEVYEFKSLN